MVIAFGLAAREHGGFRLVHTFWGDENNLLLTGGIAALRFAQPSAYHLSPLPGCSHP
jgi:hypothetical protein